MTVPVHSTVPNSTLSPFQVRQKLRGLGDSNYLFGGTCLEYDVDGVTCLYEEPNPVDWSSVGAQPDSTAWPFDTATFGSSMDQFGQATSDVYAIGTRVVGGDVVVDLSDGTSVSLQENGHVVTVPTSSTSTSSSGHTVTSAQSSAWPSLINALSAAGVKIATVALLPAGTSLTPNGTIVGSGQSLVRPGVITSNSLTSGINALLQNPMFLIGGFGILALAIFAGGRR